jgi:tetratricopeptide (TPR) repeat protein
MTTTAEPATVPAPTSTFREQGNDEYRNGNYLKAAANYTKAIKEEPESAALFSNRSAALVQLSKLPKALADAEECIRLEPEWDKGYFRKGAVLESQGKLEEVS